MLNDLVLPIYRAGLVSAASLGHSMMLLHYLGEFLRGGLLATAAGRLFNDLRRSGFLEPPSRL